jgi:hypothetical protein
MAAGEAGGGGGARGEGGSTNKKAITEKSSSSFFSCCRKRGGGNKNEDYVNNSFFRRPKAIFQLLTMLSITFGVGYAMFAYQWGLRDIASAEFALAAEGAESSSMKLVLSDGCNVKIHGGHTGAKIEFSWETLDPLNTDGSDMANMRFASSSVDVLVPDNAIGVLAIEIAGVRSVVTIDSLVMDDNGVLNITGEAAFVDSANITTSRVLVELMSGFVRFNDLNTDPGSQQAPGVQITAGTVLAFDQKRVRAHRMMHISPAVPFSSHAHFMTSQH